MKKLTTDISAKDRITGWPVFDPKQCCFYFVEKVSTERWLLRLVPIICGLNVALGHWPNSKHASALPFDGLPHVSPAVARAVI